MQLVLRVLKRQQMEQAIGYPRYIIGATGKEASSLHRHPLDPLPFSELIFLYKDDDIRAWLLANLGNDPLDMLVLEARLGQDDCDMTPGPASGRYPFSTANSGITGGKRMIQGKKIATTMRATTTKSALTKTAMAMTVTSVTRKRREKLCRLIAPLKASLIW